MNLEKKTLAVCFIIQISREVCCLKLIFFLLFCQVMIIHHFTKQPGVYCNTLKIYLFLTLKFYQLDIFGANVINLCPSGPSPGLKGAGVPQLLQNKFSCSSAPKFMPLSHYWC